MQTAPEQPAKTDDEQEYTFSVKVGTVSKTPDPFLPLGVGRVRYSRFNSVPKNTLYLLRADSKHFFFGISRCNLKDDDCNKATGRTLALNRAVESMQRHKYSSGKISIDKDGHTGFCTEEFLPLVEKYFYNLDRDRYDNEESDWF